MSQRAGCGSNVTLFLFLYTESQEATRCQVPYTQLYVIVLQVLTYPPTHLGSPTHPSSTQLLTKKH